MILSLLWRRVLTKFFIKHIKIRKTNYDNIYSFLLSLRDNRLFKCEKDTKGEMIIAK